MEEKEIINQLEAIRKSIEELTKSIKILFNYLLNNNDTESETNQEIIPHLNNKLTTDSPFNNFSRSYFT